MWWSIFHSVSFILVLPHVKCQPSRSVSDHSLKHWFLIHSGEGCSFPSAQGTLSRPGWLSPIPCRPQWDPAALTLPASSVSLWEPHKPLSPSPLPSAAPLVVCSLSLTASGFDPNTLFSLWRNIFDSPGVAAVDNGNLLCFMCLENEFPCQKRRAIITSKRDQIGSLKRK